MYLSPLCDTPLLATKAIKGYWSFFEAFVFLSIKKSLNFFSFHPSNSLPPSFLNHHIPVSFDIHLQYKFHFHHQSSSPYQQQKIELASELLQILESNPDDKIKKEALKYDWNFLYKIDKEYATKIKPQDSYRVNRAIELFLATNEIPTRYFKANPPKPIINNCQIYEIDISRDILRERIKKRTKKMFEMGLIDEVAYLEAKYKNRSIAVLKAIGVKEVLEYFDGGYNKDELFEKIVINTARLAKRQQTFNKTQFLNKISLPFQKLKQKLATIHQ